MAAVTKRHEGIVLRTEIQDTFKQFCEVSRDITPAKGASHAELQQDRVLFARAMDANQLVSHYFWAGNYDGLRWCLARLQSSRDEANGIANAMMARTLGMVSEEGQDG